MADDTNRGLRERSGMGQNSGDNLGFGGKMLIIFYGLGLAVIGAQPLQKQYGSLRNFVNVQWRALSHSGSDLLGEVGVELSSKRTREKEVKTLAFPDAARTGATDDRASGWFSGLFGGDPRRDGRARLTDPTTATPGPQGEASVADRAAQKDLDRLSHTDRKQLSNLIDDL